MVSIIIPAYNAAGFLEKTIQSVFTQTYTDYEVIVVDDGSTDETAEIAKKFAGNKLRLIRQQNAGVSRARNKGLEEARGEWVVFLDADDLLTPAFVEKRLRLLEGKPELGYAGGWVETFPEATVTRKAVAEDPVNQVLFFHPDSVTIPSNYLFRKEVLLKNNIFFHPELSSTADRFFILQLSGYCKGAVIENDNKGKLLYRVSPDSMSGKISPSLIRDNEKFYSELVKAKIWPAQKARFRSLYFLSLAKGFALVGNRRRAILYTGKSILAQPVYFAGQLWRDFLRKSKLRS